jgi:cytochrome c2
MSSKRISTNAPGNIRNSDGIDRRGFLKCMQWAGTGLVWTFAGGVPVSRLLGAPKTKAEDFTFVQISDSHIGFNKPANPDVAGTLQAAVDKINALERPPDFLIHTGDLTHLAKAAEFDQLEQILKGSRQQQVFYAPGEHDVTGDDGKQYMERFGKGASGRGWQSFDHKGVHFVGLNNVVQLEGLGAIGQEQLDWLKKDLGALSPSTPVVMFAHIPLWSVYPQWGWGTADGEQALALLRRFGSVTILNGHIHQTMQKVEGNVTFHTAMSTAFPQPTPGTAPGPGPMKVPAERLGQVLGICNVNFVAGSHNLAVIDAPLGQSSSARDIFERRCTGCHSVDQAKVGPPMRNVYGSPAARDARFQYSDALKKAGITWDDATLDKWLADPDSVAPGTDMSFRLDNAAERANIIAYLKKLATEPRP